MSFDRRPRTPFDSAPCERREYRSAKASLAVRCCVVALGTLGSSTAAWAAERPNIVLIVIDDMGYGDLGCYGSQIHKTPEIDRLASQGMRFTNFHTNGAMCSPTRAALMIGGYQQRCGVTEPVSFTNKYGLSLEETTVAELLADGGYVNGVFGKWHLGHVDNFGPNNQGFHQSRCTNNNPDYHTHVSRDGTMDWFHNHKLEPEEGYLTDLITRHTCEFLRAHREQPFFVYMPHVGLHFPFQGPDDPPHRTLGKNWDKEKYGPLPRSEYRRAYKDMLEAVDRSIGQVVATLEELKLRDNTLIFLTSDNGAYPWVGSNGPYRGGKGGVFEGGHRVPAIANWPGRIKAGAVCDQTTMTMDLLPTFVSLAGAKMPQGTVVDGVDLTPLLLEERPMAERLLFWQASPKAYAVREGTLKYVVENEGTFFFDLASDPGEQTNLADRRQADVQRLEKAYQGWLADVLPPRTRPRPLRPAPKT